jgi:hypothetical protein
MLHIANIFLIVMTIGCCWLAPGRNRLSRLSSRGSGARSFRYFLSSMLPISHPTLSVYYAPPSSHLLTHLPPPPNPPPLHIHIYPLPTPRFALKIQETDPTEMKPVYVDDGVSYV